MLNKKLAPFFVSVFIFIALQLQGFNLGLGFRDEGFLNLNALRILGGEIPYRDFFMTTTPLSFYIQAAAIKIFGNYLIESRIIYIVAIVISLLILNLIYNKNRTHQYIASIASAILLVSPAALGFYNTEGFAAAICSFYFLRAKKYFLAGILIGLTFLFKQTYGIYIGFGFFLIILEQGFAKYKFKNPDILKFALGSFTVIVPFFLYLEANGAFVKFYYYSVIFAGIVKSHREAFILKSIVGITIAYFAMKYFPKKLLASKNFVISITIVLGSVLFFLQTKSYFEPSRIYYFLFLALPIFVLAKVPSKFDTMRHFAFFLLFFFLANAASGRSIGIANIASPLFIPLAIDTIQHFRKQSIVLILILASFHVFYLSRSSIDPNGKVFGIYPKGELTYDLSIKQATYIKVSKKTKNELEFLASYIDKSPTKKLLCFSYCPLANVLFDKQSPSYFSFFYPEAFLARDQNSVINDLKNSDSQVLIQKKGDIEQEAEYEDARLAILKSYITHNYKKNIETDNFILLSR